MTDTSFDRGGLAASAPGTATTGDALVYRSLFLVLFIFSIGAILVSRLFGGRRESSVLQEARQAAHATAGYTFQC